jgi:hypothetical protein
MQKKNFNLLISRNNYNSELRKTYSFARLVLFFQIGNKCRVKIKSFLHFVLFSYFDAEMMF